MKTSLQVQNLKCGGCAKTITSKISEVENISDVSVDINSAMVSFVYKNTKDAVAVRNKLKALGYPSVDSKNSIASKAISFVSCATGKMSS